MIPSRAARLALLALALTVFYTAWLGDDCYFTLRTVENFLAGDGLRWNLFERVQAYTHPLWMFVLSGAIGVTGEHYLTTIGVSMAFSLAAALVLARSAVTPSAAVLVLVLLLLSRAFVDYCTSGLENPLTYFLAALFLREFLRAEHSQRSLVRLALLAGLSSVTRLDSLLVYLPALAAHTWTRLRASPAGELRSTLARTAGGLLLGFLPLVLWELFSCFYYGFPFPNTAYAKLGAGIPRTELLVQGLRYLADSLRRDPPTLVVILIACALPAVRGARALWPISVGIGAYLLYVLNIGGGFMAGRFLALPLFLAVGLLGTRRLEWREPLRLGLVGAAFLLGLHLHQLVIVFRNDEPRPLGIGPETNEHGIDDERFCYFRDMGLLRPDGRFRSEPPIRWVKSEAGLVYMFQGRQAFQAGRDAVALEPYGLADPLLARLPARFDDNWRIGHFERVLPRGYRESLASGAIRLEDEDLARYNAHLRRVTSGPLFSLWRLRTALELNLGRYDSLIRWDAYRFALRREALLEPAGEGRWRNLRGKGILPREGTLLEAPHVLVLRRVTIELEEGAVGAVLLLREGEVVRRIEAPQLPDGARSCTLELGDERADALWILPARGPDARIEGVLVEAGG